MGMVPTCATCQGYGTQILLMRNKKNTVHALDRKTRENGGASGGQRMTSICLKQSTIYIQYDPPIQPEYGDEQTDAGRDG